MNSEPTISQNYNYRGMWKTLSLSDMEIEKVRTTHRAYTNEVMRECLADAKGAHDLQDCTGVACTLFEARVDKFFTWIMRALRDKTRMARANGGMVVEEERIELSSSSGGE